MYNLYYLKKAKAEIIKYRNRANLLYIFTFMKLCFSIKYQFLLKGNDIQDLVYSQTKGVAKYISKLSLLIHYRKYKGTFSMLCADMNLSQNQTAFIKYTFRKQ
jgi:hypothetical protein